MCFHENCHTLFIEVLHRDTYNEASERREAFSMKLSVFGFQALWSPYFLCVILIVSVLFFVSATTWRHRFLVSEPLTKAQAVYFSLAMMLLYIVKGTPIDVLAHISFTMHMVQMALLLLFVPIVLIKGIPWWMWQAFISLRIIRPVWRVLTQPIVSLFTFTLLFSFYHIPVILDVVKLSEPLHAAYTGLLFSSAVWMYWSLLHPIPDSKEVKDLHKIGIVMANAVLITPACALIIFADTPMYETYIAGDAWLQSMALCVPASTLAMLPSLGVMGPELFMSMSTLEDQQLGGIVMKIIQEIIFGALLYSIFRKWYKNEQKNADAITAAALEERKAMSQYY